MAKKIKINRIEAALNLTKKNFGTSIEPWYKKRIGEVFTVDVEFKDSYYVKEYSGSVIKEDAEIIDEDCKDLNKEFQ